MSRTFSVITINYNNLKGLKRTLKSVWGQTARDHIECIVVDGGSTDGAVEFLQENAASIDTLIIEPDKGIYDAMNKGLQAATGEFVWFVNSGDEIRDAEVAAHLLSLADQEVDVIFGDTMFVDPDGHDIGLISRLKPQPLPDSLHPGSFRFGMNVCHQSFIARRTICPPYDLQYRQAADIDWIIRILKKAPATVKSPRVIACFEIGGSSSQNEKKAWKERFTVLASHYGYIPNLFNHLWIFIRRILFNLKGRQS